MKRTLSLLLALLLTLGLCACGGDGGETTTQSAAALPEEICGVWYSNPDYAEDTVELHPNGMCVVYGEEKSYTVTYEGEDSIVLDAQGIEIQISLYPQGVSEIHLGGNWEFSYVQNSNYFLFLYSTWFSPDGDVLEVLPAGVSMSGGFFQSFTYVDDIVSLEVTENGETVYTIASLDPWNVSVVDAAGNEVIYTRDDIGGEVDPGGNVDPGWDDMDEAERLELAYIKALDDFNAAISDKPVYDEEGNEITSGPALAEYLYNQFVALGNYEDASYYLAFFKTRTETVTTERWYQYIGEEWGGDRESVIEHDLPDYDVFGRPDDEEKLAPIYGILYQFSGNKDVDLVYNEHNVVTQVIITMTDGFGEVKGTCVSDLEYNEFGQHIATHVAFVDEAGNDVRYTSTFDYDSEGRLIRVDIPYVYDAEHYGHTYTYLYRYDENGRCVLESIITTVVDESWYGYGKQPGFKHVTENFYDENGLLVRELTHSVDFIYPGGGQYEHIYTYDEEQRLVKEELFTLNYNFDDYYREHGIEKTNELIGEYQSDFFYPGVSYDEATLEDWFSMEQPVDISKWDAFLLAREPEDVRTYTYSETTIMYIDLNP